jgi:DNA processing protein
MPAACEPCLRRAWLLGRLAVHVERINASRRGFRAADLLALDEDELLAAVASHEQEGIRREAEGGARDVRQRIAHSGSWATCRHDDDYPDALEDLERAAPYALIGRGDPALLARISDRGAVASIVGARKATSYGLDVARELAGSLALTEVTVVSGMALGIDSEAHRGALESGWSTVAVLAGGADVAYPASHAALHREITERGLVISEMPPGTRPARWMFPARNRLIAGLAGVTVVVQAGVHSGSLITARIAADLGREVGAVPGDIHLPASAGAHALVADGAALISGPQAVLDRLVGLNPLLSPVLVGPALSEEPLRRVLGAVEEGCATGDEVAAGAGIKGGEAAVALAQLELLGYVTLGNAGGYLRTQLRPPAELRRTPRRA